MMDTDHDQGRRETAMKQIGMRLAIFVMGTIICTVLFPAMMPRAVAAEKSGETLYKEYCAVCHPNGMNIINPKKTLSKKDLDANKVQTEDAIVKLIRNPGPGMTKFDANTISERDAREIAKYILKTFNK
jgi:cytochrome c6